METPANHIGVRVSSRAKNAGWKTLIRTNAGRPTEKATKAQAVAVVSEAVNAPRSNRTEMIGSAAMPRPMAAGKVSISANSNERFWLS